MEVKFRLDLWDWLDLDQVSAVPCGELLIGHEAFQALVETRLSFRW